MKTVVIEADNDNSELIEVVKKSFEKKLPVVVPTETVYGLAAPYNDPEAIESIYRIKNRPNDNPLIVHIFNYDQLNLLIKNSISEKVKLLLDRFWPGPLTILLEKSKLVPEIVTAGSDLVAIRMPSHPIFRFILKELDCPLVAPSANLSGRPSPTKAMDALEDLNGLVEVIINGGQSEFGLESTVIKITNEEKVKILRPGFITKQMIATYFKNIEYGQFEGKKQFVEAPGMKYKHYSPKTAKVFLIENLNEIKKSKIENENWRLICLKSFSGKSEGENIISFENEESMAKQIFALFRELDREGIEKIYVQKPIENIALLNRVLKAAE